MKHIDKQKDISKITIKKEEVNGKHCLQQPVILENPNKKLLLVIMQNGCVLKYGI